jgi:asparagine synthase (glutamine-hydrolysing)
MEGILPGDVLWRKKSPYPKTFDPRYTQIVETRLTELLKDKNAPLFEIVNRDALSSLLTKGHPWPWYGQLMKRPQTIAYFLQMDYWLRKYEIDFV